MVLQADQITDLANSTLNDLGKLKLVEVASTLTEYQAASNLLNKNRIKFDSGKGISWNLLQEGDDNAKNVGLYNRDNVNVKDGTFTLELPWRHTMSGCAFDVREQSMNSGAAKIVDYVATKRMQRAISWVELFESNFWQGVSGATDDSTPYGVFGYWLAYNATTGFNGGNGNFGTIGGKDATVYDKLKHYTFQYAATTDTDLVDKLRDALVLTDFKPMVGNGQVAGYTNGQRRVIYTTLTQQRALEKLVRANNDNLGSDLDKYHGSVRISQVPVEYSPWINANKATSQPYVCIDWAQFHAVFQKGWWMKETPFAVKAGQHNVRESFIDCSYNFRCFNRRKGMILGAKSDPLAA